MNAAEPLLELICGRRSVRRFRAEPVDRKLLARVIEAATWAPSAGNRQDWMFTVVVSEETRAAMADAVRRRWAEIVAANQGLGAIREVEAYAAGFADFARAPAVVVVSARRVDSIQKRLLGDDAAATAGGATSAALAAGNLMLAAHALGLGTCCMTGALAARAELQRVIGLGRRHEIVCLVAIGWPAETPGPPPRKPVEEVMRFLE